MPNKLLKKSILQLMTSEYVKHNIDKMYKHPVERLGLELGNKIGKSNT